MKTTNDRLLLSLIEYITTALNELNALPLSDFDYGQKSAFVECLEVLQSLGLRRLLDYDIEKRGPV